MTTATIDEPLVSAPENTILFMCRRSDLRLVKTQRYPIRGASGQQVGETPGEVVAFRDGALRLPKEGTVRLEDGRAVDVAEILAWLEDHRLNGDTQGGFWRVDPTAPAISRAELDQLMEMVLELDDEKLQRFVDQERAGWGREDLLEAAEKALMKVLEVKTAPRD
ncbi:MAG TPA: hypothetical protein VGM33_11635 [Baekduia sp.]|jgi:hypothetical protein